MNAPASRRSPFARLLLSLSLAASTLLPAAAVHAQAATPPPTECRTWADSGALDERFRIWVCLDGDTGDPQEDIATLAGLIERMWGPMTQAVPEGMGPPLPDGVGANVSKEYGGDGRIDFYLLRRDQAFFRDGRQRIPGTAHAASLASGPFTTPDGAPRNGSSGFVLVDRDRLDDTTKMSQDLIHEFFHVLQYAHNERAVSRGALSHWFVEASATWAETYYDRDQNEDAHGWFPTHFQTSEAGLEDPDEDHQYSAYVWPLFMEQEVGPEAVFKAWAAIDGVRSGDFAGVTAAIDAQLPFASHFRDFAVRNLNNEALDDSEPRIPQYTDLDLAFFDDVPPADIAAGSVAPGGPWVSPPLRIPPLAARYAHVTVADDAREIRIDVRGVSPAGQVDGDVMLHDVGGTWRHEPLPGGFLKLCRDDPGEDVDALYLVISNHDRTREAAGTAEVSAKTSCKDTTLEGTIAWTGTMTGNKQVIEASGSAHLFVTVDPANGFGLENDGSSTYRYDYQRIDDVVGPCTPTHEEGALELSVGGEIPKDSDRGLVLISGFPEESMAITFAFVDVFDETCGDFTSAVTPTPVFLGCGDPMAWAEAPRSKDGAYTFACTRDEDLGGLRIVSHVTGTLAPMDD